MCGRYTLRSAERAAERFLGRIRPELPQPRYNITPGDNLPVIRASPDNGQREWVELLWGLVPSWTGKTEKAPSAMVNARSETVAEKRTFRAAFQTRRCIVPADGFYEWKRTGNERRPYFFRFRGDTPFALAAIWEKWIHPEAGAIGSFCLLTSPANSLMAAIHHRMPVILADGRIEAWLDTELNDPDRLQEFLQPYPPDEMESYPVDPWVNKAGNEGPRCIEPWRGEEQGELPLS